MNLLWILARTSGLAAVVFLSAVMVLGILSSADFGRRRWSRFVTNGLHRRIAYLACAMLGLHIITVVADSYVDVGAISVMVPFTSGYERFAVGLGALAFDAMVVLIATSLTRQHLPFRVWQMIHVAAYAAWPLAILHGVLAGTDDLLSLALTMICALAVGSVALFRVFNRPTPAPRTTGPPPGAAALQSTAAIRPSQTTRELSTSR